MSITLDDRDFSFTYSGSWFHGGQAGFEYDNTTTGTNTAGSMALFNFSGVSVSVFGTVGPIHYAGQDVGAPISSYQVDGQPAVTFTAPAQGGTLFHHNFFTSPTLGNGPHQLKITNLNQSSYLWLDYVQYTPLSATSSSPSSPATTNSQQSIPISSSTAPEPLTNPSSSPVPQTSVQTTKKNNAPVIGGVVGGVLLVVAVLALIFYLRRQLNAQAVAGKTNVENAPNPSISEVRSNYDFSTTSNAPLVGLDDWPRSNRSQPSVIPPSTVGIGSVSRVEDLEADTFFPRQIADEEQVYVHDDGGVRIAGGPLRGQVDIPPEYREYL